MLTSIASHITHFSNMIATVTGIDVEVVDSSLVRLAGTGIHAEDIGKPIKYTGALYTYALRHQETVFVDNPRHHAICALCRTPEQCVEKLTMCAPIVIKGRVSGIIALLCYTDEDRERVLRNRDVYVYFVRQMADAIVRVAESEWIAKENRQRLDSLLGITNSNNKCILVFDSQRRVSFMNEAARLEFGIETDDQGWHATISGAGNVYSDMDELELTLYKNGDGRKRLAASRIVLGTLTEMAGGDPTFREAIVFESKQRFTEMVSQLGSNSSSHIDILNSIIGAGVKIRNLKKKVARLAPTSSTVLISGESGTGKELFARAIHAASNRKDKPFIAINCGAIPDSLMESELFGYVRGAFTNADPSGRIGKFELADQGVLFLDEISSMPIYMQVKLLRVLQERTFNRLGSNKSVSVDLRIIAATNEDLRELVKQKRFREDLLYRLNVIPIELPPLRERTEDIPVLADYFLQRYCRLFGKPVCRFSGSLMRRLRAYDWPGNIRELENCVEYMVSMHAGGNIIAMEQLPANMAGTEKRGMAGENFSGSGDVSPGGKSDPGEEVETLATVERRAITAALAKYGTSVKGKHLAAEALGIGIATLYRKIRDYA